MDTASILNLSKKASSLLRTFSDKWKRTHWPITAGHFTLAVLYLLQALTLVIDNAVLRWVVFCFFIAATFFYIILGVNHLASSADVRAQIETLISKLANLEKKHRVNDAATTPPTNLPPTPPTPLQKPLPIVVPSTALRHRYAFHVV